MFQHFLKQPNPITLFPTSIEAKLKFQPIREVM